MILIEWIIWLYEWSSRWRPPTLIMAQWREARVKYYQVPLIAHKSYTEYSKNDGWYTDLAATTSYAAKLSKHACPSITFLILFIIIVVVRWPVITKHITVNTSPTGVTWGFTHSSRSQHKYIYVKSEKQSTHLYLYNSRRQICRASEVDPEQCR